MGFTDKCDIFAAFHEEGFNRLIGHVRRQRPSLFNYATAEVARSPALLCQVIEAHPIVSARKNPLLTVVPPLPIPGTPYGLNFAVQLVDLQLDFHPGDQFALPPQLAPPLKAQHLALRMRLCGGLGCPPPESVDSFIPPPPELPTGPRTTVPRPRATPTIPLPTRTLLCFCVDAYATGHARVATYSGTPYLELVLDGFELVDIKPNNLESSVECYVSLLLKLTVLPGLRLLLQALPLNLTQGVTDLFPKPTNVLLSPTPTSTNLANNPAIEEELLKVFIQAEVI